MWDTMTRSIKRPGFGSCLAMLTRVKFVHSVLLQNCMNEYLAIDNGGYE